MPGRYSSHQTSVSFNGVPIGFLTGFDWEGGIGQLVEATNVTSPVIGVGAATRVVKQYDVTTIEPMKFSFSFWGPPSYAQNDAGTKGTLVFSAPGWNGSATAILTRFFHSGRAGQWSTGGAEFQLTG